MSGYCVLRYFSVQYKHILKILGGVFVGNNFQNDELQVGQYDAAEAEAKRKKIRKRVKTGVGVSVLLAVLGYFGLVREQDRNDQDTPQSIESMATPSNEPTAEPSDEPMTEFFLGGNGAWFNSVIVFFGG